MSETIKIGTMVQVNEHSASYLKQILPYGFERVACTFGHDKEDMMDPEAFAEQVMPVLDAHGVTVGAIEAYGNPLLDTPKAEKLRQFLRRLAECAHLFRTDIIAGFAGRIPNCPVPESIPKFKEVWTPICEFAGERNVRVAFENCNMGGTWGSGSWNIAFNPRGWELMFEAIPLDNIGLEWEPTHQMSQLIDPMPQLQQWGKKIFHLHGKDANVRRDVIAKYGFNGPEPAVFNRHPGFGDCNWTSIISELRRVGFKGAIDIEGWHDPVYKGDLEMTGQVYALDYLKRCRTTFVPNPTKD